MYQITEFTEHLQKQKSPRLSKGKVADIRKKKYLNNKYLKDISNMYINSKNIITLKKIHQKKIFL